MMNIKQLTQLDTQTVPTVPKTFPGPDGTPIKINYAVFDSAKLGFKKNGVVKLGYCCESKGLAYPIYLTIVGAPPPSSEDPEPDRFFVGKTGMFEFQSDEYKKEEEISILAEPYCTEVKVPLGIKFTLDYCFVG